MDKKTDQMKQFNIEGMSCAACSTRIEKAVSMVPGVTSCSVSLLTNSMGVEGNADESSIMAAVTKAGYSAKPKKRPSISRDRSDSLRNIDIGAACTGPKNIQDSVADAESTYINGADDILIDRETPILKKRLIRSVAVLVVLMYFSTGHVMFGFPAPAIFDNLVFLGTFEMLTAIVVMVINGKFFTSGIRSLLSGAPNMDTLVALGSAASFGYSIAALLMVILMQVDNGYYNTMLYGINFYFDSAAMIPTLITVGKLLESISKGKTTDALKSLMRLAPKTALIEIDGRERLIDIAEVKVGDIFIVKPGGSIPVDARIIEGSTSVNEAALTGESLPVDKGIGDFVSAATINQEGFIRCTAVRVGEDTTLAQVIKTVSDAAATKAPIARIADRVSGIFVPVVIGISLITLAGWMIAGKTFGFAIARAISVLVISCPCALGLATPVAIMVGSGVGAKNGILYKTAASLESLGRTRIVALDKTGTVTNGEPEVTDVLPTGEADEAELIKTAYLLEKRSEHPLAKAVVKMAEERFSQEELYIGELADFTALPGNGLKGRMATEALSDAEKNGTCVEEIAREGKINADIEAGSKPEKNKEIEVFAGSFRFISSIADIPEYVKNIIDRLSDEGKTPILLAKKEEIDGDVRQSAEKGNAGEVEAVEKEAVAGKPEIPRAESNAGKCELIGIIAVADTIKEDSAIAISELKSMGIHTVMLTGDNEKTADSIGKIVGVDEIVAGLLPDDKAEIIKSLMNRGETAMVGDGINDAPALTVADTGIAIGAGSDIAIDAADIVIMKSRLTDLVAAVRLSRATIRNIHENLFWAFIYNIVCIPLAIGLLGIAMKPVYGAAAMSISSFSVCMNALRLNFARIYDSSKDKIMSVKISDINKISNYEEIHKDINTINYTKTTQMDIDNTINTEGEKMKKTLKVEGMMCRHCEAAVKKALEAIDGVESAAPDHKTAEVQVALDKEVPAEILRNVIEDLDYKVMDIE